VKIDARTRALMDASETENESENETASVLAGVESHLF
jgi:hypothetical protein